MSGLFTKSSCLRNHSPHLDIYIITAIHFATYICTDFSKLSMQQSLRAHCRQSIFDHISKIPAKTAGPLVSARIQSLIYFCPADQSFSDCTFADAGRRNGDFYENIILGISGGSHDRPGISSHLCPGFRKGERRAGCPADYVLETV